MGNSVMVTRQFLVLVIQVRILVPKLYIFILYLKLHPL